VTLNYGSKLASGSLLFAEFSDPFLDFGKQGLAKAQKLEYFDDGEEGSRKVCLYRMFQKNGHGLFNGMAEKLGGVSAEERHGRNDCGGGSWEVTEVCG